MLLTGWLYLASACSPTATEQTARGREPLSRAHITPDYIIDPTERVAYLTLHYWDDLLISQPTHGTPPILIDSLWDDFAPLLDRPDIASYAQAVVRPLERLSEGDLAQAVLRYRQAFFAPDAPYPNSEVYRLLLAWLPSSGLIDLEHYPWIKDDLRYTTATASGQTAPELIYQTPEGKLRRLSRLSSPLTLLYLSSRSDEETKLLHTLTSDSLYTRLGDQGRLQILYIDLGQTELPPAPIDTLRPWVHTGGDYHGALERDSLYDTRARPALYLLDADRQILLGRTTPDHLHYYLTRHSAP